MKVANWSIGLSLVVFTTAGALAKDWFDFDRAGALQRLRAAVEKLDALAPIPPLRCRPRALAIRYCEAEIIRGVVLQVTTTPDVDKPSAADFQRFMDNEQEGKVYEIEVRIAMVRDRASEAAEIFDTLCKAAILAVRPSLGVRGAAQRYATYMRRSLNRAAAGDGEVKLVGNPETLIIDSWRDGSAYCKVSAEDDHRLPN